MTRCIRRDDRSWCGLTEADQPPEIVSTFSPGLNSIFVAPEAFMHEIRIEGSRLSIPSNACRECIERLYRRVAIVGFHLSRHLLEETNAE